MHAKIIRSLRKNARTNPTITSSARVPSLTELDLHEVVNDFWNHSNYEIVYDVLEVNGISFGRVETCYGCRNDYDCSSVNAVLYDPDRVVSEIGCGDRAVVDDHHHAVVAPHRLREGNQTCWIRAVCVLSQR